MFERDLVILKFGGSVLQDQESLDIVVDECHQAVHSGRRVIAVISAYQGMTDLLQAEVDTHKPNIEPGAGTAMLSLGEVLASAQAGLALMGAGLDAHVSTVREIGLTAEGDPFNARPTGLNTRMILRQLDSLQVLVIPGYMAVNTWGQLMLLGRGGSDLTAMHLACSLDAATCTLIKDVDGLHEADPRTGERWPRRYRSTSYETAHELGSQIIQPQALALAADRGRIFTVRSSPSSGGTIVGGVTILEPATRGVMDTGTTSP